MKFLKIAATVFVERDDFTVKDSGAGAQASGQVLKLRKFRGDIALGARKQAHVAILHKCDSANAIPLDLEKPVRVGEGLVRQFCQRDGNLARHRGAPGAGQLRWIGRSRVLALSFLLLRLGKRAAADHGLAMLVHIPHRVCVLVTMLDQQPLIFGLAAFQLDQHETSIQFFAVQTKLQLAALKLLCGAKSAFRFVSALIPDDDFAGAVVSFGNSSFKFAVVKRVIFHLNR